MKEESCIVVEKVAYGMTIGDLKFGNVRPGVVEATLKPGHTLEDALDELDDRLNAWHRKRYPHLYGEPVSVVSAWDANYKPPPSTLTTTGNSPTVIDLQAIREKENLEIAIDNATSLNQLEEIKDRCWKHDLSHQYIIKFNELNNGSTGSFTEGLG